MVGYLKIVGEFHPRRRALLSRGELSKGMPWTCRYDRAFLEGWIDGLGEVEANLQP